MVFYSFGTSWPAKLYVGRERNGRYEFELKLNLELGYLRDIIEDKFGCFTLRIAAHPITLERCLSLLIEGRPGLEFGVTPRGAYSIHRVYWDPFTNTIYFNYGTETTCKVAKTIDGFATFEVLPVLTGAFMGIASSLGYRFFANDDAHMLFRTRDDKLFEGILTRTAF